MKRIARIIPLLVLLVSCRNEQEDPAVPVAPVSPEAESEVFYGTTENGPDSKAFADADLKVLWNADDRVSIFAKDNYNRQYRFTGEDGANAGAFERVDTGDASEAQALTCNYAVYPYSPATAVSSDGVLTVSLPAEQAYKENSFGAGAGTMVAVSEDNRLSFKNVGTFVAIQLYGEGVSVSRITLQGRSGEKLAGPATVKMDAEGAPVVTMAAENASETVSLVCAEPVALGADAEHATAFWFVLPPTTFAEGFSITVEDSAGRFYEKVTTRRIEFHRSALKRMAAFQPVSRGFGLYPASGEAFVYDPATDQMNVYEAAGNAWFRFLRTPGLKMYELGPIPLDQTAWENGISTQLVVSEKGMEGEPADYELSVRSYQGGILNLVSGTGDQFVIRL